MKRAETEDLISGYAFSGIARRFRIGGSKTEAENGEEQSAGKQGERIQRRHVGALVADEGKNAREPDVHVRLDGFAAALARRQGDTDTRLTGRKPSGRGAVYSAFTIRRGFAANSPIMRMY